MKKIDKFGLELLAGFSFGIAVILFANLAFASDFLQMREYRGNVCYDGDTCYVSAPVLPGKLSRMSVRVLGIDTPEIKGKCEKEKELALIGRQTANKLFRAAKTIEFKDLKWDKYGGRILSNVYLDGLLYSDILIDKGLARSYDGGAKKGWCDE
jgi:endonuclease YncB( thermonuclease family)